VIGLGGADGGSGCGYGVGSGSGCGSGLGSGTGSVTGYGSGVTGSRSGTGSLFGSRTGAFGCVASVSVGSAIIVARCLADLQTPFLRYPAHFHDQVVVDIDIARDHIADLA
jgi:hypothetical protein